MVSIDQKVLDHFSQRSEQIQQKAQELKESGLYPNANDQKLREMATLGSRATKKDVDMDDEMEKNKKETRNERGINGGENNSR